MTRHQGDDTADAHADESVAIKPSSPDVVLVHDVNPDGKALQVLRYRDEKLEAGEVRPLEHGKPIQGEVVRLRPRKEMPLVCDVAVEVPATGSTAETTPHDRKGPAQVASDRYRENWDRIWKHDSSLSN